MTADSWNVKINTDLPSQAGAGRGLIDDILRQLEEHEWVQEDIFGIHLALEEALVNAIKHGNRFDADKTVNVLCNISPRRMRVEITDQGEGFRPGDVPDPTVEDNLDLPSGRGIMLMRSFMSLVEYSDDGNRVIMEKTRGGE